MTDIQIAQQADIRPIREIAAKIGIEEDELELYGRYKAKLSEGLIDRLSARPDGKLILVTAINPTPAGEGKTTTTVGLAQGMARLGKNAVIALREPSLGPVFGVKGGAAGGGYAQVIPMEDINLHFTGDLHAITTANNLLCAMTDNHIQQGNALGIDARTIKIKRCMDMNDRELRFITAGLGGKANGVPREDGFVITAASEVMAVLCLAEDIADLKKRLGRILIGYTFSGEPVYASDINAQGAMTALLKDAIKPNLVQTLEGTPAIMHGGPFANIAHGCNSVRATRCALKLGDYCITEAGFGSDLGAEKFFDIKCRAAGLSPSAVVLVATVRALKYNGGLPKDRLTEDAPDALRAGIESNLRGHIENLRGFGLPVAVAINRFPDDRESELDMIAGYCGQYGVRFALSEVFSKGGEGGEQLAKVVCELCEQPSELKYTYELSASLKEKIETVAKKIYGADGVDYSSQAEKSIKELEKLAEGMPVCIAKTQYSFSDDPKKLGRPSGYRLNVRNAALSGGAGFVVVYAGEIMTMPGLPKVPAANAIDVDDSGVISGLF